MRGYGLLWACALLSALMVCGGCVRKRFGLEVDLSDAHGGGVEAVYYADGGGHGMVSVNLPLREGKWKGQLPLGRGAVVFLYSEGYEPFVFVTERGDDVRVSGSYADPLAWKATGNDTNDFLSKWLSENKDAMRSHDSSRINGAVEKGVKGREDRLSSAVLLLVYFNRSYARDKFAALWSSLSDKVRESDIVRSLGAMEKLVPVSADAGNIPSMSFYSSGDTLVNVRPGDSPYSVFFFWEREGEHGSASARLRRSVSDVGKDVRVVDVCMRDDTLGWRRKLAVDSVLSWTCVWSPGAEVGRGMDKFGIEGSLYFVLSDSMGKILYRGASPEEMFSKLK